MKYFVITISAIIILIFLGYKYINYKLITSQENSFKKFTFSDTKESPRYFPDSLKLANSIFWELIENSKAKYPTNFDAQMKYLSESLSRLPNKQIIGFERTLREKVIQLWDYNIKSLYQIIYGEYLSTDIFIYFRFWIISNGQQFFRTALENTDELAEIINANEDGEGLLYVADDAFKMKNRTSSELELPSNQSYDVDYDFGNYKMTGTYIELKDFEIEFPKLTKKFKKAS